MIRRGSGAVWACVAALVLASCSSTSAPSDNERFTLSGFWGGAVDEGPPGTAYSVDFSESSANLFWISYSGIYATANDGSNGVALALARQARVGPSVDISFNGSRFHGNFADANTVVGRITIESHDYPLTIVRPH
jgi:hypothetical protein